MREEIENDVRSWLREAEARADRQPFEVTLTINGTLAADDDLFRLYERIAEALSLVDIGVTWIAEEP